MVIPYALFFGIAALFVKSFWLGVGAIAGLLLLAYGVGAAVNWFETNRPCPHGVWSGSRGACDACKAEQARWHREIEKQALARQQKERIKQDAKKLKQEEIERLSNAWLTSTETYQGLSALQFENAIAELFRKLGYKVKQTPFVADGGLDATAEKGGKRYVIECKKYEPTNSVGRRDVQILVAAMHDVKGDGGFFITTGVFSRTAREYASKYPIELYDRVRLPSLVHQAYPVKQDFSHARVMCPECGSIELMPIGETPRVGTCANGHRITNEIIKTDMKIFSTSEVPYCDRCGIPMRKVWGYRRKFWGCPRYPKCRETRPIER